ncbi:MAG: tetratricopeptide repeat-containing protein [Cyanobacteria bacterium SZAS-4]|nr:tetratricopeptide repeat-containing protein [Cyanobacteria bacterium SZAS-4]
MTKPLLYIQSTFAAALCALMSQAAWAGEAEWTKYSTDGAKFYEQANWGSAERSFKLALKEADSFGDKDLRLASSLTNLGVLYNFRGQSTKAEPLFERAVAIKQKALGGDNPEVVATVGKMCHFYLKSGNYMKGDALSNKILAYADKTMREHAQPSPATKESDLDLATLLDGLGGTYTGAGKLAYGEQFYKRSLQIREKILSPSHIAIASSCENLAKLYMTEGRAAQAEPLYRRALEISRKVLGEGKPETLTRTDGLAQCCIKLGNNHEAESLYHHALEIVEKNYGKNSGYLLTSELSLSAMLAKQGRYAEAAPLLSQAVKVSENLNGPQHASLSPILDSYAEILEKTNHKSEAAKLKARAKAIRG